MPTTTETDTDTTLLTEASTDNGVDEPTALVNDKDATLTESPEDTEDVPTPPPSAAYKTRVATLQSASQAIINEKEEIRLRIETEYQTTKDRMLKQWNDVQQSYDARLAGVHQELLKAQGVYEFLLKTETEDAAKNDDGGGDLTSGDDDDGDDGDEESSTN